MIAKSLRVTLCAIATILLAVTAASAQITISNGISGDGYWDVDVNDGGESRDGRINPIGDAGSTEVIYDYFHYVDVGADGGGVQLSNTTITQSRTLSSSNEVTSSGTFAGENGTIAWEAISTIEDGSELYLVELSFTSTEPFGTVRLIQYLDEDVGAVSDDEIVVIGTPGERDFQLLTVDGSTRVGVAQGAFYFDTLNMTYVGWNADEFPELRSAITGSGAAYSISGVIDTVDLPPRTDDQFPGLPVYGLNDITTAVAFDLDPTATTASVLLYLGGSADGSAVDIDQPIESPVFTKFNTYLAQYNYLELSNSGTADLPVVLTFYNTGAAQLATVNETIPAGSQRDLSVNTIVQAACDATPSLCQGFSDVDSNGFIDMIGLISVAFDDSATDAVLSGRMSNYRLDPGSSSFSFAFARELNNGLTGTSYSLANTIDPLAMGYMIPNWLELVNLSGSSQTYTVNTYALTGGQLATQSVTLPAMGQADVLVGDTLRDGFNQVLQAAYLVEVVPESETAPYLHYVSRYSSNSTIGFSSRYNFAFSAEGRNGSDSTLYVPLSAENLSASHCAEPMSWVEVANVSGSQVELDVFFKDYEGNATGFVPPANARVSSMGQAHYQATPLMYPGRYGLAEINAKTADRNLIAQSVTYYYNCDDDGLQTAFLGQSWAFGKGTRAAAVNSYLGMSNELRLVSSSSSGVSGTLTLQPFTGSSTTDTVSIPGSGIFSATFGSSGTYSFPADTYGLVSVDALSPFRQYAGILLRTKTKVENGRTRMDYVVPVAVK